MKNLILSILITLTISVAVILFARINQVDATNNNVTVCRPTATITPTLLPSVTPTSTITPTASPSATLTPTATPEAKLESNQERHDDPLTNDTTHKSNPNCDTPKPGKPEVVTYHNDKPNDGTVRLEWSLPLRAKTVNIYFGTDMWNYQHSVIEYPNVGHIDIGFLDPSKSYWYTIEGKDGCATGERSYPIDPAQS